MKFDFEPSYADYSLEYALEQIFRDIKEDDVITGKRLYEIVYELYWALTLKTSWQ